MRVLLLVVEVIVALRVRAERRVVPLRSQHERRAAAPAPHQLGGNQLLRLRSGPIRLEEVAERADMLFQATIGHEAAVAREDLRLRLSDRWTGFIRVAENELSWLQRGAGARCGFVA